MRSASWLLLCCVMVVTGCGVPPSVTPALGSLTSVTPSSTGQPNSVAILGNFEFVSEQRTGQIFSYNFSGGTQVQVGPAYAMPCTSPGGMAIVPEGSKNIMAVTCYDTSTVLTLNVASDGTLSSLGSVVVPGVPYPEIAADGTNVFVPLFTRTGSTNGGVAKLDVSNPTAPVIAGSATLASPFAGAVADATALTVSGGYIYIASGSESMPLTGSSSVQVVNESTMQLVGTPLVVPHSPQQIVVSGGVAYISIFDDLGIEAINVANPSSLSTFSELKPSMPAGCNALALAVRNTTAYLGCYGEGNVDRINVSAPATMTQSNYFSGLGAPQSMVFSGSWLFVVSSATGGSVYQVYVGPSN